MREFSSLLNRINREAGAGPVNHFWTQTFQSMLDAARWSPTPEIRCVRLNSVELAIGRTIEDCLPAARALAAGFCEIPKEIAKLMATTRAIGLDAAGWIELGESFREAGIKLHEAAELMAAAPSEQKIEAVELMQRYPLAPALFKRLKSKLPPDDAFSLILDRCSLQLPGETGKWPLPEVLLAFPEKRTFAAANVLRFAAELLPDPALPRLLAVARGYSFGAEVVEDYAVYISQKKREKASAILKVGEAGLGQDEFNRAKSLIRQAPEARVAQVDWATVSIDQSLSFLRRQTTSTPSAAKEAGMVLVKKSADWYVSLKEALRDAPGAQETAALAEAAYEKLPLSLKNRIRSVWHGQIHAFDDFCRDVVRWNDSAVFRLILADQELFGKYQQSLDSGEQDWRTRLADRIQNSSTNPYRDAQEIFAPEQDSVGTLPQRKATETRSQPILPSDGRIFLIGGYWDEQKLASLRTASGGREVRFIAPNSSRAISAQLRQADAIICITGAIDHMSFYSARDAAKVSGARFIPSPKRGIAATQRIIGQICGHASE